MAPLAFECIARLLAQPRPDDPPYDCRTRAAVAMILRQCNEDMEMLFIERAADDRDPWSGNLAFPGGKVEPGETLEACLAREIKEELGIVVRVGAKLMDIRHAYSHRLVHLHIFHCRHESGRHPRPCPSTPGRPSGRWYGTPCCARCRCPRCGG